MEKAGNGAHYQGRAGGSDRGGRMLKVSCYMRLVLLTAELCMSERDEAYEWRWW